MVTGDHPGTATAIADEVGLRRPTDPVLVGRDLPDDDATSPAATTTGCAPRRGSPALRRGHGWP